MNKHQLIKELKRVSKALQETKRETFLYFAFTYLYDELTRELATRTRQNNKSF